MISLICPGCGNALTPQAPQASLALGPASKAEPACNAGAPAGYSCDTCNAVYPVIDGIPVFLPGSASTECAHTGALTGSPSKAPTEALTDAIGEARYYDGWHKEPHKRFNVSGIGVPLHESAFINRHERVLSRILYTKFQRRRFFEKVSRLLLKNNASDGGPYILDLGCGTGNKDLAGFDNVYGIDYSIEALRTLMAGKLRRCYKMAVNGDAARLPFAGGQFDCVLSSDFIGHVPAEKKEQLFAGMARVLKPGGLCAHVIETDNDNFVRGFAKKYPDLYKTYFIDAIGGHVGMEMPDRVLSRFAGAGLVPVSVTRYYTYVWDVEAFVVLFDNEYKEKSAVLRALLNVYRALCKNFYSKLAVTFATGAISFAVDRFAPLSKAEGILVIARKT